MPTEYAQRAIDRETTAGSVRYLSAPCVAPGDSRVAWQGDDHGSQADTVQNPNELEEAAVAFHNVMRASRAEEGEESQPGVNVSKGDAAFGTLYGLMNGRVCLT